VFEPRLPNQKEKKEMENKCVCCGVDIPEGRQVCPNCQAEAIKSAAIAARTGKVLRAELEAKRLENETNKRVFRCRKWI
jgi:uncharacterized OB-fold protein